MVNVLIICPGCRKEHAFEVTEQQFLELQKKEKHIQDILPNLKPEDREMFISGFCSKCWDKTFADDDLPF